MVDSQAATMGDRRALLTEREREIITGEADVSSSYRYQTISRVRSRFERLDDDLRALGVHGDLLDELRDVVCEEYIAGSGVSEADSGPSRGGEPRDEPVEAPGEPQTEPEPEDDQSPSEPSPAPVDGQQAPVSEVPEAEPPEDHLIDYVGAYMQEVDFPMSKRREDCVAAVAAAYEYLQNRRKATMRDFVQDVMPDHPLGYDVPELEEGDRFRGAWWRKIVRPGLGELPEIQSPQGGDRWWRYQEEGHD